MKLSITDLKGETYRIDNFTGDAKNALALLKAASDWLDALDFHARELEESEVKKT